MDLKGIRKYWFSSLPIYNNSFFGLQKAARILRYVSYAGPEIYTPFLLSLK